MHQRILQDTLHLGYAWRSWMLWALHSWVGCRREAQHKYAAQASLQTNVSSFGQGKRRDSRSHRLSASSTVIASPTSGSSEPQHTASAQTDLSHVSRIIEAKLVHLLSAEQVVREHIAYSNWGDASATKSHSRRCNSNSPAQSHLQSGHGSINSRYKVMSTIFKSRVLSQTHRQAVRGRQ